MRRVLALFVGSLLCLPNVASATPFARVAGLGIAPQPDAGTTQPATTPPGSEPTSSKAPESGELPPAPEEPPPEEPAGEEPPPEGPEPEAVDTGDPTAEVTLESEREQQTVKGEFNEHGVGARGGIVVIPTWILSGFLASHTNALCRGENMGSFAEKRGLLKTDGCNFFVAGEYTYRKSRIFDIVGAIGYQSLKAPDGYWLDTDEWDRDSCDVDDGSGDCNLAAADYTEIGMHLLTFQADFVARYPVVVTPDVEIGIGGGAGIGLGVIFGGVYQTALGSDPMGAGDTDTCNTLEDLKDFTRCTPRYDPEEYLDYNGEANPNPPDELYAECSKDNCSTGDLKGFGYRKKQEDIPPVYPIVNLILSARFIVKDVWGINITGGWNTGFYFGGSMSYFFAGKPKAK